MSCCGPSIKRVNENTLFETLRKPGSEISLKLGSIETVFTPNEGCWKCNYKY